MHVELKNQKLMENTENLNKGHFITFEGLEGCGKSTHVELFTKKLAEAGKEVLVLREPGGRELCEKIRTLLKHEEADPPTARAELLLFLASRAQLVEKTIKPALERGVWVICDRFSDSTVAYQGSGRGLDKYEIIQLDEFARDGLKPDMTFYLDVPLIESFKRIKARAEAEGLKLDRIEMAGEDFFKRVRDGFMSIAAAEEAGAKIHGRFTIVDSDKPREDVAAEIWKKAVEKFEKEIEQ